MKTIVATLALLPGLASAAMSADEYLAHCQTRTTYDQAVCTGYLDALLERRLQPLEVASLTTVAVRDPYCLPEGTQLREIRTVVISNLQVMRAAQRQADARPLITSILSQRYPASACAP